MADKNHKMWEAAARQYAIDGSETRAIEWVPFNGIYRDIWRWDVNMKIQSYWSEMK